MKSASLAGIPFVFAALVAAMPAQALTVGVLQDATSNGWSTSAAPWEFIRQPVPGQGNDEWFSRYTKNNPDAAFNVNNSALLAGFKNAPAQSVTGLELRATSSTVRVSYLGTGAVRDSFLFVASDGSSPFNSAAFMQPAYAAGATDNYHPINASNALFQTRGGCQYLTAKAGNTCAPADLGSSRTITGVTVGNVLTFGLQAEPITVASDGIVFPDRNFFFTGTAASNTDTRGWMDGLVHAKVQDLGQGRLLVGFEDSWGGGDKDYNDVIFLMQGVQAANPVPEPASLLLLAAGLGVLALRRRRH